MNILAIDPGLAHMGIAVVSNSNGTVEVVDLRCFETKQDPSLYKKRKKKDEVPTPVKAKKKPKVKKLKPEKVLASTDNYKRALEIIGHLQEIFDTYKIDVIAAESMSFPRSASPAAKTAICWGIIATLGKIHNIPLVQLSPQKVKIAVCGKKDASKEEVQAAMKIRFDLSRFSFKKTIIEHPFDAGAVAVACLDADLIKETVCEE